MNAIEKVFPLMNAIETSTKMYIHLEGDWVLQQRYYSNLDVDISRLWLSSMTNSNYDKSLLMWHVATELCYYTDDENIADKKYRECSKLPSLSSYPCIQYNATLTIQHMRGSGSVLSDACQLAEMLKELGSQKWEMIYSVLVEMLCYAACNCKATIHYQQLSEGMWNTLEKSTIVAFKSKASSSFLAELLKDFIPFECNMDTDISRILLSTVTDSDYDQSQLKLHITTELCYYTDDENTVNKEYRIANVKFLESCEETEILFRLQEFSYLDEVVIKPVILSLHRLRTAIFTFLQTEGSGSVLSDACQQAKMLKELGNNKWEMIPLLK
ncbi:hypothetical protein FEM48_Zijuj07G0008100 [Ziziphus jujuba var. spinosa]|uniref:Uncharacterized protein n=1 Tax=Ziziphus jujuba var. spinosa TaxID=714518 RepID=A0A978V1G7_ZIZJJ|nr:hypothetical protein FEM48_Zijuj07G0008100 [Ziziphus jujuba var. spinosa]